MNASPPRPAGPRFLIVNADDFGIADGVNRGIARAHETGIVTSASLMVRPDAAREAGQYAQAHPALSVGLHFDAGEWRFEQGNWIAAYEVIDTRDARQVEREMERQLEAFRSLTNSEPTHLDSHQHMHFSEPARSILGHWAARLGIPLRGCTPRIIHRGEFYGQTREGEPFLEGIAPSALRRLIETLPSGWSELGCHPGYPEGLDSVYAAEREEELLTLCDPSLRETLPSLGVQLASFRSFLQTDGETMPRFGVRVIPPSARGRMMDGGRPLLAPPGKPPGW